jgi:cellulose synthase/poly-beta-1,6-N-acetylglucosamine synthase-like glycosyltransferase
MDLDLWSYPGSAASSRDANNDVLVAKTKTVGDPWTTSVWLLLVSAHMFYLGTRLRFMLTTDTEYARVWTIVCLAADFARFLVILIAFPVMFRQQTEYVAAPCDDSDRMYVNCVVVTYKEPIETVRKCLECIIAAKLPPYAVLRVHLGDDGPTAAKKAMCAELGVEYVGDRIKRGQLNGKSANLNNVLSKIYAPGASIPETDVIMVMDCDHNVDPAFFEKTCPVLLDGSKAVCLVPQAFHNTIQPDFLDNSNELFMFGMLPYFFGIGATFITGTNFMIRATACYAVARDVREPFSESLVAEDVDLGSRLHFHGYKSVVLNEALAWGEVPLPPREIWKQRDRWAKAGHLYVLSKDSVFWKSSPHMSAYAKLAYCCPMIIHLLSSFSEPVTMAAPALCVLGGVCPYGMDRLLWLSHVMVVVSGGLPLCLSTYFKPWRAVYTHISSRVQLMVAMKAVVNTTVVMLGVKSPGGFKTSTKAGAAKDSVAVDVGCEPRKVLPYDGTIDVWYIVAVFAVSLYSTIRGMMRIATPDLTRFNADEGTALYLMAVVFCAWECVPGATFLWYCVFYNVAPWTLKIWVPLVCTAMFACIMYAEVLLALSPVVGYVA